VSYSKTGLSGPTIALTKLGWTVFEKVQAKNGRRWLCNVEFVSKKSIVRSVLPKTIHLSLIVCLCCTIVSGENYAWICTCVYPQQSKREKNCLILYKIQFNSAIHLIFVTRKSSQNNQVDRFRSWKTRTKNVGHAFCRISKRVFWFTVSDVINLCLLL
jgi:ferredoxin-thioredoxin reductase catalytic subunit